MKPQSVQNAGEDCAAAMAQLQRRCRVFAYWEAEYEWLSDARAICGESSGALQNNTAAAKKSRAALGEEMRFLRSRRRIACDSLLSFWFKWKVARVRYKGLEAAWMLSCAWLIPESRVGSDEPVGNPSEYSVHGFLSSEAR